MKLGIHLSSFTPKWEDDVLPLVAIAGNMGYQAVEFPLMFPNEFDYKEAGKLLKQYNMTCTCGTGLNPMADISSADASIRLAGKERLKKCIEITEHLESDCLGGVLYAPWGERISRNTVEDRYGYAIESLVEVADFAKAKGVTLSLEILNRYESFFMNTMAEGLGFIGKTGCDNVKLHFDTFHAHIEEANIGDAIRMGGSNIWHVHLCDNNRGAPGSGSIDFPTILKALHEIGYDRNLMVENFVIPNSPAGEETCIWRKIWDTPEENARQAFAYMTKLLEKGE